MWNRACNPLCAQVLFERYSAFLLATLSIEVDRLEQPRMLTVAPSQWPHHSGLITVASSQWPALADGRMCQADPPRWHAALGRPLLSA